MKQVTPALAAYLASFAASADQTFYTCNLFTITLQAGSAAGIAGGQVLALADLDEPVLWNGYTYLSNSLLVGGLKYNAKIGVEADKQQISLSAWQSMTIGGVPFLQALQQGLLDGAEIQRERAFFTAANFTGLPPHVPIGTEILFKGRVTSIDHIGRTTATASVESDLTLLKTQMPLDLLSPTCIWVLYGQGCGVNPASYTFSGVAGAGSTTTLLNWSGASALFQQGTIAFTSGENEGLVANIKSASAGALVPTYPFLFAPAAGDTFTATWGCDHTTGNASFTGSISGTTLTVTAMGAAAGYYITADLPLFDTTGALAAGQSIVAQLSGTIGGVGTYQVGISQTVASERMFCGQGCAKFNNIANFRGTPFIPPPQVVSGPLATSADASKG